MSKQTAVEFLIDWLENLINISTYQQWLDIKDKAIAMEREQHQETFLKGFARTVSGSDFLTFKEYFAETYGKEATDANG